jgi:acyl carrier protein
VEATLLASGRVSEVSVQVGRDRGGDDALIAYVVPAAPDVEVHELRRHVREHLPAYMVPASFVLVDDSLPLNANGKLDARALRELALPAAPTDDPPAEASTATEGRLEAIWLEVLDVPDLRVDDDFFALGGDSWKAVEVAARASRVFRREVPVLLLFEHPTLASLAEAIDRLRAQPVEQAPAEPREAQEPAWTPPAPAPEPGASDTLARVVEIWQDVLGVPTVGPDDDFIALGGHSLNATKIVSRTTAVVGHTVPLDLLFAHPTAASFADVVDRLVASAPEDETAIERGDDGAQDIADLLDEVEGMSDEQLGSLLGPES